MILLLLLLLHLITSRRKARKSPRERVISFLDDLYDVFVLAGVGEADPLRGVFGRSSPHQGVLELVDERPVNAVANVLDGRPVAHDESVLEIGPVAALFRVDADERQGIPYLFEEIVEVEFHVHGDDDGVGLMGDPVHFLDGNLVDLVVDIEARHVDGFTIDNVYEVVRSGVLSEQHLGVVDLILVEDGPHHLLVHPGEIAGGGEGDPARLLLFEINFWFGRKTRGHRHCQDRK